MSDDEDVPKLAPDTLAILNHFLEEKRELENTSEDWQLSQFWYDDLTTKKLVNAALNLSNGKIALVSCPTLMQPLIEKDADAFLFEFDKRFSSYGERFILYDYRDPLGIPNQFQRIFDLVIADPPFLSEECLTKALKTVDLLKKAPTTPVLLCTGAVMEQLANSQAQLKPSNFVPKHKNNLANEFRCYTNFGDLP